MLSEKPITALPPHDFYRRDHKMYVATDCIVFGYDGNTLKLLLFQRKIDPFKNCWSLIGSFVHLDESIDEAAKRVLEQMTGLTNIFMAQTQSYGSVERDPGFRCISIAQYALIRLEEHNEKLVEGYGAKWFSLDELPQLILDHRSMVDDALGILREKVGTRPIGFELLPLKFTLPQLQRLYESIYQMEIDPRNFRKKVLSLGILIKLGEKDKTESKKGAFLHRFDDEKYNIPFTNSFNFDN